MDAATQALALLEEMKGMMIAGKPFDIAVAFRMEECISALRASAPEPYVPPAEPRTFTAESLDEMNSVLRDGAVQEPKRDGIAGALGGMFARRE